MLFNSYIFIFLFLPICLVGYFGLNKISYKAGQVFLLGMSLWFYGYFNPRYLLIIVSSICVNYAFYTLFKKELESIFRKVILVVSLILNVGLLFYFKYYDFFVSTINPIFKTNFALKHLLLPLGISFFTFQQISFVVDSYRNEVPNYNFVLYASFVTYFPQLIAGPIVTHDELVPQFEDVEKKKFNWDNFAQGLYMFALGLSKKVLIADTFGNAANIGYADVAALDSTNAIIVMLAYTFQIYFDFSGYCDMAVGLGKMMNIDLPINFDSPYKAFTINEFWKRWHKTLTRFLTKYIYIPLGGNRRGKTRMYINTMIVFVVSGLWHGAAWNFVFWGALHGVFSIISKMFKSTFDRLHPALNWMITFGFVNVAWVYFRASSFKDATMLLGKILHCNFGNISESIANAFKTTEISLITSLVDVFPSSPKFIMMIWFAMALFVVLGLKNAFEKMNEFKPTIKNSMIVIFLMIWCIVSLSGVSTFLYFNF